MLEELVIVVRHARVAMTAAAEGVESTAPLLFLAMSMIAKLVSGR